MQCCDVLYIKVITKKVLKPLFVHFFFFIIINEYINNLSMLSSLMLDSYTATMS